MTEKPQQPASQKFTEGQLPGEKPVSLPVHIPVTILRWLLYSAGFCCLLIPFASNYWQMICGGLILGHFASQLNALIKKP